jgi:hypothetical protein
MWFVLGVILGGVAMLAAIIAWCMWTVERN